jgi:D-tyrosyl-tRNA(Tyr) deacylase
MRIVVQRVIEAKVIVDNRTAGAIGTGLLVLLAVETGDTEKDADYLVGKTVGLRIFNDADGRMNLSLVDVGGALLIVSQFTLYGDCRKGMRPSYDRAARPEHARRLYEYFVAQTIKRGMIVETGVFQASMQVALTNDGPVTLVLDSPPRRER